MPKGQCWGKGKSLGSTEDITEVKGESGMKNPIAINLGHAFSIAFLLGNLAAIKKSLEKNKRAPGHSSYKLKDAHFGPCLLQMFANRKTKW